MKRNRHHHKNVQKFTQDELTIEESIQRKRLHDYFVHDNEQKTKETEQHHQLNLSKLYQHYSLSQQPNNNTSDNTNNNNNNNRHHHYKEFSVLHHHGHYHQHEVLGKHNGKNLNGVKTAYGTDVTTSVPGMPSSSSSISYDNLITSSEFTPPVSSSTTFALSPSSSSTISPPSALSLISEDNNFNNENFYKNFSVARQNEYNQIYNEGIFSELMNDEQFLFKEIQMRTTKAPEIHDYYLLPTIHHSDESSLTTLKTTLWNNTLMSANRNNHNFVNNINVNNSILENIFIANNISELLNNSISNSTATVNSTNVNNNTTENRTNTKFLDTNYDDLLSLQGLCLIAVFFTLIVITVIGNTLVILAVITTRRLRTVTNCFVMSLAVADLLVGIFVMPPAVAVHLIGSWQLGWVLCDIWISLDVLLCTASILSLCAISIDRYLAVTRPLTYSRKRRSKRLALIMILIVWSLALAITCPPILGWYEPGRRDLEECRYNQNEGYVIFSAMGSFFIPMAVMIYVYGRISCVVASRHDNITDMGIHSKKCRKHQNITSDAEMNYKTESEQDSGGSPKHRKVAARTLSNQTIGKDIEEVIIDDNTGMTSKTNGNYELITSSSSITTTGTAPGLNLGSSGNGTSICGGSSSSSHNSNGKISSKSRSFRISLKRQSSAKMKRNNSSLNIEHWSFTNRHSIHRYPSHQQQHHNLHPNYPHHLQQNMRAISSSNNINSMSHNSNASSNSVCVNDVLISTTSTTSSKPTTMRIHKTSSNRITSLKKENKTTQTLSIVVGGFIACWLPFFIYYLITPFLSEESVNRPLANFLTWLGWFNSAINPFIYAFYSVDFRAAFWRLTFKRFFKNSSKKQFSTTMSIRR